MIFSKGYSLQERKRAAAILVLFIASSIFWQRKSRLALAQLLLNEYQSHGLGQFPASWFQNVQPLFVLLLAPLYAWL
jgi:POT family proton-dependent oligopeptide transporter